VQRGERKSPERIAGEDAAGAVGAVRRGRQPEQDARAPRVAEAGIGRPQYVSSRNAPLLARDLLAPGDEPRAAPAVVDSPRAPQRRRQAALTPAWRRRVHQPEHQALDDRLESRMSSGSRVRIWRDASSITAPTIANASCGDASRTTP
jgi:hypothetical protein